MIYQYILHFSHNYRNHMILDLGVQELNLFLLFKIYQKCFKLMQMPINFHIGLGLELNVFRKAILFYYQNLEGIKGYL